MDLNLSLPRRTLVTGGTGFIGSHQVVSLLEAGFEVAVVDDLSNSWPQTLDRIQTITGKTPWFHQLDIRDTENLRTVIHEFQPDSVVHMAGRKHVGESTQIPQDYYDSNVGGLLSLLAALRPLSVRKLVFSSSGSVYGPADRLPIPESHPHRPTNPYSATKSMCERVLSDLCAADPSWSVVALRYFNPTGAHSSGLLGEFCIGRPSNLMPALIEAGLLGRPILVHGDDYNTADGTGVRDYVHVEDVAEAHLRALNLMEDGQFGGFNPINVGRGIGLSVLELVEAMENTIGRTLPVRIDNRRPGDVATLYGDTRLATELLGMDTYRSVAQMCDDAWRFRTTNPNGYRAKDTDSDSSQISINTDSPRIITLANS